MVEWRGASLAVVLTGIAAVAQAQGLPELLERAVTTHPSVQGQRSQRAVARGALCGRWACARAKPFLPGRG